MTFKIKWYSSLSTGIPAIDEQHRTVDQCRLFRATVQNIEALRAGIHVLKDYLTTHFAFEESYRVDDLPFVTATHRQAHDRLRGILQSMENNLEGSGPIFTGQESADQLSVELIEHVGRFDMHSPASPAD
ncbi:hypothetical protein BVY04_02340 [bacterium M21]|nr:hypothetical protein BVY04_02340 [bacterium M21]